MRSFQIIAVLLSGLLAWPADAEEPPPPSTPAAQTAPTGPTPAGPTPAGPTPDAPTATPVQPHATPLKLQEAVQRAVDNYGSVQAKRQQAAAAAALATNARLQYAPDVTLGV